MFLLRRGRPHSIWGHPPAPAALSPLDKGNFQGSFLCRVAAPRSMKIGITTSNEN